MMGGLGFMVNAILAPLVQAEQVNPSSNDGGGGA